MQLKFLYNPVSDIEGAADFFRDQLGFEEAWRDGSLTVAFQVPDGSAQVMCSLTDQPPGPMYLVDDLDDWINTHPDVEVSVAKAAIPGGAVAGSARPTATPFTCSTSPTPKPHSQAPVAPTTVVSGHASGSSPTDLSSDPFQSVAVGGPPVLIHRRQVVLRRVVAN